MAVIIKIIVVYLILTFVMGLYCCCVVSSKADDMAEEFENSIKEILDEEDNEDV